MDISNGMDKSWDHPWTTEEMRKKRREWSLAGDAGLLKHLQQFSDNVISRANKTQEILDSLTTQLNETAIFIDNITNTSLALANTQFIESRVQEDNIEIGEQIETSIEQYKDQDSIDADLIANVSETVKQGLNIMYEKYKEMEFVDSDSDSEEEDNKVVLSVVLGPNDPYQDRVLPYVIGSEKWKNSNKIGLESSSSSESEQIDEEEEESENEDDGTTTFKDFSINTAPKTNIGGLLPSLNGSDYSKRNDIAYISNEKIDAVSQSNIDSVPESITPNDNVSKTSLPNNITPNFAEELAKRLGTVRQAQKPGIVNEKNEASINRFKDDLFTPEEDENILNDKSRIIFSEKKEYLNDQSIENLSKDRYIKSCKIIIPASIDVPPPISTVSTKPKSAIDDLFADTEPDDIFSPKNITKIITKNKYSNNNNNNNQENMQKKCLETVAEKVISNMATSTPETIVNTNNLFSDDEDIVDLFGPSKNQEPNKKKSMEGMSISGNSLTSNVENKLSNRILRNHSSGSSGSNTSANYENNISNESVHNHSRNTVSNDNINDFIVNNAENSAMFNESNYSSGISIYPPSINNTGGSSIDIEPRMSSTRLKSEEIYRERITSDSLFTARTHNPVTSISNTTNNPQVESIEDISSIRQDDVFENEDLFGPPPLPKADSKLPKSKIPSLFDDSDSGDELFSTTSSGSRSQRSSDLLTTSQYSDKIKSTQRRGLFDEEINIFDNKDSPDVDIFGIIAKPKEENNASNKKFLDIPDDDLFTNNIRDTIMKSNGLEKSQNIAKSKEISLFDNDIEDSDLFSTKSVKSIKSEIINKSDIFNDDYEDDLFSIKKPIDKKKENDKKSPEMPTSGIDIVDQKVEKSENKNSDILSSNGLFSTTIGSHGLIFEDDDYDDLFSTKNIITERTKEDEHKTLEITKSIKEDSVKDVKISNNSDIFVKSEESNVSVIMPKDIKKDLHSISNSQEGESVQNIENELKMSPPKSLDIHTTAISSSPDKNSQTKRIVSGKIKNLMGKMGDLKMISPMDTPPVWRKSKEKTDEEDNAGDRDSDDGGCVSTQGHNSPLSASEDSITTQKQSQQSTISDESNVENAISFDEPVQIETLSTTASKTRVRIQAKRRPQSRHARKSAIRQSGIDFDTVDALESNSQDESQIIQSPSTFNKEISTLTNISAAHPATTIFDHSNNDNFYRTPESNIFLSADDKSELGSISKESSMSANKNTLLSPSTDEEDLFDVLPDLPEDPQKEDMLFGRAPILSPVEKVVSKKPPVTFKILKDTHIKQIDDIETETRKTVEEMEQSTLFASGTTSNINSIISHLNKKESKSENAKVEDESKEMIDPLRDDSHDPLKDPSQLFAFVTKTPSPEKGKNLLFSEDDSLFSSGTKKLIEEQTVKKPILGLFTDDTENDLFSTTLTKSVKKTLKDTKINLFYEEDEDNSLFGSVVKKSIDIEPERKHSIEQSEKKINIFDDDNTDTNLFSEPLDQTQKLDSESIQEQSKKNDIYTSITEPVKTSHITDIFADQSSGEEDILTKIPVSKKIAGTSKSLFLSDDDDDDDNIFGKKLTGESIKSGEIRSTVKKTITRDLKKTAEKIREDPLSVLLDD